MTNCWNEFYSLLQLTLAGLVILNTEMMQSQRYNMSGFFYLEKSMA